MGRILDGKPVTDCSFCRIAAHDEPARVVFETGEVMGFFPLAPAAVGHTLVITKAHIADIWELDDATGSVLLSASKRVAEGLRAVLEPQGMNLINSAGRAASQTIMHIHFHLVPRWDNDNFGPLWPAGISASAEQLDDLARRVTRALR